MKTLISRKLVVISSLMGSLLIAGCCTSRPEPGVYFYTLDRKADWNTMYNQDGEIVSVNRRDALDWEIQKDIDHLPIVDGDDVFYMGDKLK